MSCRIILYSFDTADSAVQARGYDVHTTLPPTFGTAESAAQSRGFDLHRTDYSLPDPTREPIYRESPLPKVRTTESSQETVAVCTHQLDSHSKALFVMSEAYPEGAALNGSTNQESASETEGEGSQGEGGPNAIYLVL